MKVPWWSVSCDPRKPLSSDEGSNQIIEIPLADSEQEKMALSKALKSILHDAFEKLEAENN